MAPRRRTQRTNPLINLGIAIAVLAGIGVAGYAVGNYLGFFETREVVVEQSREGLVAIPKSLSAMSAFEKVNREDVYDRTLGEDSYFWLPKDQVDAHPEWITRVEQVIGRVMARDKRVDFVFSENDFLPEGSRVGLSGGVPDGKQGFFLDAEQIPGLRLLKIGDRFDLMASLPEESANAQAEYGLLVGGIKARGNKPIPLNGVRLLVQSGTMIALTNGRSMTTQGALEFDAVDSRGRPTTQTRDEQVAIAIDAEEVVPLTQALGDQLKIHAVARSGQKVESVSPVNELAGLIAFPAAAVSIQAYRPITAQDLAEPLTGELRQYYFKPNAVSDDWIGSVGDLLGRVVRRDIDAGYIFTEDDLLPKGAPSGISGGIPAGRMAMTIATETVAGLAELSRGNRCDVMSSARFDLQSELGSQINIGGRVLASLGDKAINTLVAVNALVVDRQDDRVTLAVMPSEIAGLTKSLALKTPMFSIAKPGGGPFVGDAIASPPTELTSDANPFAGIAITEMIIGGDRRASAFRKSQ